MQYLKKNGQLIATHSFTNSKNKVKDLEENSKKLDENLKTEHEKLVLIINNSKETHDKVLKVSTVSLIILKPLAKSYVVKWT